MLKGFLSLFRGKPKKTVMSVREMTLKISGMRTTRLYKAMHSDKGLKLERYYERFSGSEHRFELETSCSVTEASFIELMNTHGVMDWDGFHGKHPRHVSDGDMFSFSAVVNDGLTINADGSANYPNGYRDFVRSLDGLLAEQE